MRQRANYVAFILGIISLSLFSPSYLLFSNKGFSLALCDFWVEKGGILKSCPRDPKLGIRPKLKKI